MPTYEPIATTTLTSPTSTITFSGVPSTYTDLRLIIKSNSQAGGSDIQMTFNSDTGTNYNHVSLYAQLTTVASFRGNNQARILLYGVQGDGSSTANYGLVEVDILDYKATDKFKTTLAKGGQIITGSENLTRSVGMWRRTNAITSISLATTGTTFHTGSTATLYGILAA